MPARVLMDRAPAVTVTWITLVRPRIRSNRRRYGHACRAPRPTLPPASGASMDVSELVTAALAGGAASTIIELLGQRRERRDLRAAVLRALSQVEQTRWAPASWEDFRETVFGLRAALVAGANREVVDSYVLLLRSRRPRARRTSRRAVGIRRPAASTPPRPTSAGCSRESCVPSLAPVPEAARGEARPRHQPAATSGVARREGRAGSLGYAAALLA